MLIMFPIGTEIKQKRPIQSVDSNYITQPVTCVLKTDDPMNPMVTEYKINIVHNTPTAVARENIADNHVVSLEISGVVVGKFQHMELESVLYFLSEITDIDSSIISIADKVEQINFADFSYVEYIRSKPILYNNNWKYQKYEDINSFMERTYEP